ncbi:MAG TPA: hypothetical protein VF128_09960 [Gemmatimonadaceae bacterium]
MRFRNVIGAGALALLATSCSLGNPADTVSVNVFAELSDFQLTVREESIVITVTARNVGYSPITLTGPSDCLLFVEIRDYQGNVVWTSNGSCTGAQVTEEIASNSVKIQAFPWDGRNSSGGFLAPGSYLVRAVARLTTGTYASPPVSVALD